MGREVASPAVADRADPGVEALARDPTPSEAARLTETVELLMRELTGREREMLALALQGCAVAEISNRVARTERTVQRVLKRVRARLEEMRTGVTGESA